MPFFDIRIEVFSLAAAHCLDEINPVAAGLSAARSGLLLPAEEGFIRIVALDCHISFRAVEDIADAIAAAGNHSFLIAPLSDPRFVVRHPMADFEDDHRL